MADNGYVTFKCEDSVWQMMKKGWKTWDGRLFDINDERFVRLARGHWEDNVYPGRQPSYVPDEHFVCFLNKLTGQTLQFRYLGFRHMTWAPGWIFIMLRGLVATIESDGAVT